MVWPELGPRRLHSSLVMETMGPKARPARFFSKWQHLLLSLPTARCFRGTVAPVQSFSHIAMRRERLWDQGPHSPRGQWFSNSSIHQHWEGQVSWAFGLKAVNFGDLERGFAASFGFSLKKNPI